MRRSGWLAGLGLLIGAAQAGPAASGPLQEARTSRSVVGSPRPVPADAARELRAYQDAFFEAHLHALGPYLGGYAPKALPAGVPGHRVEVLRTVLGFALVTSGLGQRAQPASDAPPRIELVAYVPREGPQIADLLSLIGQRLFADQGPASARAWETVALAHRWYGLRRFLLLPAGDPVQIQGRTVSIFEVVPLQGGELRAVETPARAQDWAVRHPLPERSKRWQAALAHAH